MTWLGPFLLLVIFELIADLFAKQWSLTRQPVLFVLALVAYVTANSCWLFALRNGAGLARGAVLFGVGSGAVAVVLGVWWFHEKATSSRDSVLSLVSCRSVCCSVTSSSLPGSRLCSRNLTNLRDSCVWRVIMTRSLRVFVTEVWPRRSATP